MKVIIDRHASVIIVYSGKTLLTNQYDNTYPLVPYRGRVNLLGGTPKPEDSSPLLTLTRELSEEFSAEENEEKEFDKTLVSTLGDGPGAPKVTNFAPKRDIENLRDYILRNIKPHRDLVVGVPAYGQRPAYNILFHTYSAEIPIDQMERARQHITAGRSLVSEGFLRITKLDELKNGDVGMAWATGSILADFFKIELPNPDGIKSELLGTPRASYSLYQSDFDIQKK